MIFTMTIPLLEIVGHAYSEYLRRQLAEGTSRTKLAAVAPYSQKSVLDKTKSANRRWNVVLHLEEGVRLKSIHYPSLSQDDLALEADLLCYVPGQGGANRCPRWWHCLNWSKYKVAFDGATVQIVHCFSVHRCLLGGWPSGLLRRLWAQTCLLNTLFLCYKPVETKCHHKYVCWNHLWPCQNPGVTNVITPSLVSS